MLTNGSMQAVTLVAEALQDAPGDTCIVEEFSYPGTLAAYKQPQARHGRHSPLGRRHAARRARAPPRRTAPATVARQSSSTPSRPIRIPPASRCREQDADLIDIARRFDVPLVEDNCYGDVHYEGPVARPSTHSTTTRATSTSRSLSKILAPGLRLGYVLARPPMLDKIMDRRHDAGSNTLAAAIVAEFYTEGIWPHTSMGNDAPESETGSDAGRSRSRAADLCVSGQDRSVGCSSGCGCRMTSMDRKAAGSAPTSEVSISCPASHFTIENANVPYLRLAFGHLTDEQIDRRHSRSGPMHPRIQDQQRTQIFRQPVLNFSRRVGVL